MATGALDANGIWQYGEDDSESTFSALLNKLGGSTSTTVTRLEEMGGITAAQATTARENLRVGVVSLSPPTVTIATGTGSTNSLGVISFTGATSLTVDGIFDSNFTHYKGRLTYRNTGTSLSQNITARIRVGGSTITATNYQTGFHYLLGGAVNTGSSLTDNVYVLLMGSGASTDVTENSIDFTIYNPYISTKTTQVFSEFTRGRNGGLAFGNYGVANQATGIYIAPSIDAISGTLQFFGYND